MFIHKNLNLVKKYAYKLGISKDIKIIDQALQEVMNKRIIEGLFKELYETDEYFITYDSVEVIAAKYNYANNNGMGIMCWAYTEDTSDNFVDTNPTSIVLIFHFSLMFI